MIASRCTRSLIKFADRNSSSLLKPLKLIIIAVYKVLLFARSINLPRFVSHRIRAVVDIAVDH